MLLLPVAVALAVMGALAYTMTRQGAMSVAEVDRQYDLEAARYLAEAGLRLVKWRNEKEGCASAEAFTSLSLPGMGGTVSITELLVAGGEMTMTATARAPLGSESTAQRRKLKMYERKTLYRMTVPDADGKDIFIRSGSSAQGGTATMEATDGTAYPLIRYSLSKLESQSRVVKAELSLYESVPGSATGMRTLALHRLTRDWKDNDATWTFPWTSPGGDYLAAPDASAALGTNRRYAWRIDTLVRRWIDGGAPNFGVLLKPSGMNGARLNSLENASERPRLVIDYYMRCA